MIKRRPLSQAEFESIINNEHDADMKALFIFLYQYGCRLSEALVLEKKDVDMKGDNINALIKVLKGGASHTIPVSKDSPFMDFFIRYWSAVQEGKLWRFGKRCAQKHFTIAVEKAGLSKGVSIHWLRHTRASRKAEAGAGIFELQEWFGWRTITMPNIYVKTSGKLVEKFADRGNE